MTTGSPEADLKSLGDALAGDLLRAGDAGWDDARQAWNLAADQDPAAVVIASTVDDVRATLGFARDRALRVAPQATGHGAPPMGALSDAILLRTSRMTAVSVDPERMVARVEAGAKWNEVVGPAAEHGLVALHGFSGTVGAVGYSLSGGLGWLARSHGFACNSIASFEVVTADGIPRRVDPESEPDLFWALRGGGGDHAVVTAAEFELFALKQVYAGTLMWPIESAGTVAQAWRQWTSTVPEQLTSNLRLARFPPLPEVPDPLRGRALVAIGFAYTGSEAEGEELIRPLRQLADPYLDTVAMMPAPGLADLAGDPPDPMPSSGAGILLRELDQGAVEAYVDLAGPDVDVPLAQLELRHLGGALARSDPAHGALDVAGAPFLLWGVGAAFTREDRVAVDATLATVSDRMAAFSAEHSLLGFAEQQPDLGASFPPVVAERLNQVKAAYDPDGLILGNHADPRSETTT